MKIIYMFFVSLFLVLSGLVLMVIPPNFTENAPWAYPQIWLAIITLSAWIGAFYFPETAVARPADIQKNMAVQKSIVFSAFTLTAFIIYIFL